MAGNLGSGAAGHTTRVNYKWEDSFNAQAGAPADGTYKVPGADAQLTTAEGANNLRQVFRPGSRVPVDTLAMFFDGTFAMQFTYENPWFLKAFLGEATTTTIDPDATAGTGDESYQHVYDATDVYSMRIVESYEQANAERRLYGCVATRLTIEVAVEDVVNVTVEGMYAEEDIDTDPVSLTAQTTASDDPLTFVDAALTVDGTTEGYVQDMTFTLEANADPIREMGSRFAIDVIPKTMVPSVDFREIKHGDTDKLTDFYGVAAPVAGENDQKERMENKVALAMNLDNGKASGSGINKLDVDVTGSLTESYGEQGIGDPRADLEESINRFAETITATAQNETQSAA